MQKLSAVAVAVIATVVASTQAGAQSSRNFEDSWFWGAKAGVNTFSQPGSGNTNTANFGLDWLITRKKGGLYVSGDQSIFERDIQVFDPAASTGQRTVRINDLRRLTFAGVAFPKRFGGVIPYGGIGYMIAVAGDARIVVDSVNSPPTNAFIDDVDQLRSRGSVLGMIGIQVQTRRAAIFVQETLLPSNRRFVFPSVLSFFEFGIRYNFGSSIDRH
ncbi:MAG TPA: hypothetical protein VNO75_01525 [Gemmatimonadaceae bacterium]|nr:hypothetical protein [Gemmatimonadaceae bacterium]